MKIWVDDIRPAPEGYIWCKHVKGARQLISYVENMLRGYEKCLSENLLPKWQVEGINKAIKENTIEVIDIDHDAGKYVFEGGDYIKLLDWLEETGRNYPIRIHSQNPVGVANMRRIIERNGWKEIF